MSLNDPKPKSKEQLETEEAEERELTQLETVFDRLKSMKPIVAKRLQDCNDSPMLSFKFGLSGKRVIMGFKNGLLRVQMLKTAYDFASMDAFWMYAFQDNDRGSVNKVQLSFDDR